MTRVALLAPISLLALIVLIFASGCTSGPKYVKVSGKLTKGGAPLKVKTRAPGAGSGIDAKLIPLDKATADKYGPFDIVVDGATGTFTVPGPKKTGVPAGKYKIAVRHLDDSPGGKDGLNEQFSADKTKIIREINGDSAELDIDLDKEK